MAFDVTGARNAGYSETEIAEHLGKQTGFDTDGALKAGYAPADVIEHLTKARVPVQAADPGTPPGFIDGIYQDPKATEPLAPTADLTDSLKAAPGQMVASGSVAAAQTQRGLMGLDLRIANAENADYPAQLKKDMGEGSVAQDRRALAEMLWKSDRAKLPELKAERERLQNIASSGEAEIKALTPENQGLGGKIITGVAGNVLPLGMGTLTAVATRNPLAAAGVMNATVFGNSVSETNDAGIKARQYKTEIAKLETPQAKIDYLKGVLSDPDAGDNFKTEISRSLSAIQAQLAAGKITEAQARERTSLAFDKFSGMVDYVAKHATPENAVLRGAFDTAAEIFGESFAFGAMLKASGKPLRDILKVVTIEAGQEGLLTQPLQSLSEKATTDPNKTGAEILEEMGVAAGTGAVLGGAMGGVGTAMHAARGQQAKDAEALLDRLRTGKATPEDRAKIVAEELQAAVDDTNIDPLAVAAPVMQTQSVGEAIAAANAVVDTPVAAGATLPDEQLYTDEEPVNVIEHPEHQSQLNAALAGSTGVTFPGDGSVAHLETTPVIATDVAGFPASGGEVGSRSALSKDAGQAIVEQYELAGKRVVFYRDANGLPDGFVQPRDRSTIYLSDNPLRAGAFVAGHEFGHTLEDTKLHDEVIRLISTGLTSDGLAYLERQFGMNAPANPVARKAFLLKEAAADLGGFALADPTFLPKVVEQIRRRHGQTVAKRTLEKLIAGVRRTMKKVRSLFRTEPDLSAMIVSNLEAIHKVLAKMYADAFVAGKTRPQPGSEAQKPGQSLAAAIAQESPKSPEQIRVRELLAQAKPFAEKQDLTGAEAAKFKALMRDITSLRYGMEKPGSVEAVASAAERMSTLSPEVVVAAHGALVKNKTIYMAVREAAHGVSFNADTPIDDIVNGKNPNVTAAELYATFTPVRDMLRAEYGDTVKLYRATGAQKEKATTNWATTKEFAQQFGDNVVSRDIPVKDIIAVHTTRNGKYHEVIVGKTPAVQQSPKGTKLKEVSGRQVSNFLRHLTPSERARITDQLAANILAHLANFPSANEMAAVAHAGRAKRGWYARSTTAISAVFGPDGPRFASLLAALSPQTSVQSNLRNALNVWEGWTAAGRPEEKRKILNIMATRVEGETRNSILPAWINNTMRALTDEDPRNLDLSGPKVNSFFLNLIGDVDEVTNDTWMANYAGVSQTIFGGVQDKFGISRKGSGYLAFNSRVREAASAISTYTGELWTPAEVQETIWSWAKATYEHATSADSERTPSEVVRDEILTPELIAATPSFDTLFHDPEYTGILRSAGYEQELETLSGSAERYHAAQSVQGPGTRSEAGPFAREAQKRYELAAARRLDALAASARDIQRSDKPAGSGLAGRDSGLAEGIREAAHRALVGAPSTNSPLPVARDAAGAYMKSAGLTYTPATTYAQVDVARATRIADAFQAMTHDPQNPEVKAAYRAMIAETLAQWKAIKATGLRVEFIGADQANPYDAIPRMAIDDVAHNNHLWVFPTSSGFGTGDVLAARTALDNLNADAAADEVDAAESALRLAEMKLRESVAGNPLLAQTGEVVNGHKLVVNDVFRIVHDYFGHIKDGNGFRAGGEENAWRSHAAMYSDLARRAMTSETRGQNSWVNFGPHGVANRTASAADTVYADQKIGLLPAWVSEEGRGDVQMSPKSETYASLDGDTPEVRTKATWSGYAEKRATFKDGSRLSWVDSQDATYVIDIGSGGKHTGAKLLTWLTETTGHTPEAVGVVKDAQGFWDKMEARGLISGQTDQNYFSYFGLGSPNINQSPKRVQSGDENANQEAARGAQTSPTDQTWDSGKVADALARIPAGYARQIGDQTPLVAFRRGAHPIAVVGIHYGNVAELPALDATKFGTGTPAEERDRLGFATALKKRAYFYVQQTDGKLPQAEHLVTGPYAYRALVDNVYDFAADPDNIIPYWREMKKDPRARYINPNTLLEGIVLNAGYDGYLSRGHADGLDAIVVMGHDSIPVEYLGTRENVQLSPKNVRVSSLPADMQDILASWWEEANSTPLPGTLPVKRIPIAAFPNDASAQPSSFLSDQRGTDFARKMPKISTLSPVVVAGDLWLDGRHRVFAARERGETDIAAIDLLDAGSNPITGEMTVGGKKVPTLHIGKLQLSPKTPEFKKWFAGSKVVDASGEPLVVYHGTAPTGWHYENGVLTFEGEDFEAFNGPAYFASNAEYAAGFGRAQAGERALGNQPRIIPAHLKITNPFDARDIPKYWIKLRAHTQAEVARLTEARYDGIVLNEVNNLARPELAGDVYVAFRPEQVKSVFNERPTNNPDISQSPKSAITNANIPANWTATDVTGFDNFVRHLQDKLVDTKRVVQAIRAAGATIVDNIDPYLQETLFHGRAAKRVSTFAESELRPLLTDLQARGIPMQEFEDYLFARHAQERNAQIAKVNQTMPDGGSGMTNAQAASALQGLSVRVGPAANSREIKLDPARMAAYATLAARVDAITNRTLDLLVAYGLETKQTVDNWRTAYKHYAPLKRDMESDNNFAGAFNLGLGTGQGFSVKGSASQRAMGSERAVIDILANVAMQRERAIVRGEKNRISQAVYGLATKAPNPDFWIALNPDLRSITKANELYAQWQGAEADYNARLAAGANPADPVMTSLELKHVSLKDEYQRLIPKAQALQTKVEQELVRMGMNPADAKAIARDPIERYIDPRTGMTNTRLNPRLSSAPEVLSLRINGENRFVMFSNDARAKAMVEQLKNMNAEQLGYVLQGAAEITRWFASVNTQYNPVFGLVNGFRDTGSLVLNLGATPLKGQQLKILKYASAALAGIYTDLRAHRAGLQPTSVWAQRFEDMGMEGGQTGYRDMFQTSAARTDALTRELKALSDGKSKWVKINERNPIFAWLSDYNTAIENAIRVSAYQLAIENGMSKAQAANLAKNITVNFNKKGTAATTTGALYAFFNAAAQGVARMGSTMLENKGDPSNVKGLRLSKLGKQIVLGGLALGVIQALLTLAAGWDDDQPPQFLREKNFLIPMPGGHYIALPMPQGFLFFPNMGRIATELVLRKGKDAGKSIVNVFSVLMDSFNPLGASSSLLAMVLPTALDPLEALRANEDWTGRKIAKEDFDKNHPTPGWTRTKDTATPWAKALSYAINYVTGGGQYGKGLASPTPDQIDYLVGQVTGGVGRELGKVAQTAKAPVTGEELPLHKIPVAGRFFGETTGGTAIAGKFYNNLELVGSHVDTIKRMAADHKTELLQEYLVNHPEARLYQAANQFSDKVAELNKEKRRLVELGEKDRVRGIEERTKIVMQNFNAKVAGAEAGK